MHITSSDPYNAAERTENSRKGGLAKYTGVRFWSDGGIVKKATGLAHFSLEGDLPNTLSLPHWECCTSENSTISKATQGQQLSFS